MNSILDECNTNIEFWQRRSDGVRCFLLVTAAEWLEESRSFLGSESVRIRKNELYLELIHTSQRRWVNVLSETLSDITSNCLTEIRGLVSV